MYFSSNTIKFLSKLRKSNNREWFNDNKADYEDCVRTPALSFISAFQPELAKLSPNFWAIAKKMGGSMMRPYRDIRYTKDKSPYKTNLGIQFRHQSGKDIHAPGFYLHISPDEIFIGAGMWSPEPKALKRIRELIDDAPNAWNAIKNNKPLNATFEFAGQSLTNPPRGFAKDHPYIDDLKRKDFMLVCHLQEQDLYREDLPQFIAQKYQKAEPLMRFLCEAQRINY